MSEHIEDHSKLYEAARSLRGTGMTLSWDAKEISVILDEIIRLRHIVASGLAVSINQENRGLKTEVEALRKDAERYRWLRDSDIAGKILRDMGAKYRADADQGIDAAMGKGGRP